MCVCDVYLPFNPSFLTPCMIDMYHNLFDLRITCIFHVCVRVYVCVCVCLLLFPILSYTHRVSEPEHTLTCVQMAACLKKLFGLGDVAVKAAVLLYPKLTDPAAFESAVLHVAFQFDDERADVKAALGL